MPILLNAGALFVQSVGSKKKPPGGSGLAVLGSV
jgi:hypothetical protein